MNFLQVIHFFPTLSAQAFKPCGKALKDIMFCSTISGGGDEKQTRFTQQVAGCDQIVTARQTLSGGNMGTRRQGTESSTLKTQVNRTGPVTWAWGPFSALRN